MLRFDQEELRRALATLLPRARLAFAISCTERMYPNYLFFVQMHSWGDPAALREALDEAWLVLDQDKVEEDRVKYLQQRVMQAEPETESFRSIYVSSALDAAAAVGLTLAFIADGDPEHVVEIASLSRDTVDMYVQELEQMDSADPALEDKILHHRLMQRELARQAADLRLVGASDWTSKSLMAMRSAWRAPSSSNIDLGSAN